MINSKKFEMSSAQYPLLFYFTVTQTENWLLKKSSSSLLPNLGKMKKLKLSIKEKIGIKKKMYLANADVRSQPQSI